MTRVLVRGAMIVRAHGCSPRPVCLHSWRRRAPFRSHRSRSATYNVFTTTPEDSTGTITYRCNSAAANISIALSDGSSSTSSPRTMRKGTEVLNYDLYQNAARTNIWGDGTGGTSDLHTRQSAQQPERQRDGLRPHSGAAGRERRQLHRHRFSGHQLLEIDSDDFEAAVARGAR